MKNFINKTIKFIKKLAIYSVVATIVLVSAYFGAMYLKNKNTIVVEAPEATVVEQVLEVVIPEDIDSLEEARKMLEEATQKLNAEEEQLLREIEEREVRIAEINDIRASF